MNSGLSTDFDDPSCRPYFLWDVDLTTADLRYRLSDSDELVRLYWMARVMRDARYWDVWKFLSLAEVVRCWEQLRPRLGRAQERWSLLIEGWKADGLVE